MMRDGMNDERCFNGFLLGDESGLRVLMDRYGDSLTLYINGYLHDIHESEDLMIESFSRVIAKRPRLVAGGFRPYLYKTARNLALRHLERSRRTLSFELLELEPEDERRVETTVFSTDVSRIVRDCLDELPADYREALYLVYIEGMSYERAAEVMGKSRKQVDNLIARGKVAMKPLLVKKGVTDAFD
ncbi:MAG: RNA polymerase sigma factor [Coriobacteriales bacterium]|nr:RNA polymerase sigma factor [Coriobacteriales bacterium]